MNKPDRHTKPPSCHRNSGRNQSRSPCDSGPNEIEAVHQRVKRETAPKRDQGLIGDSGAFEDPGQFPKAKFRIFGEELIEKVVKANGNSGRVYLPPSWVGKHVKIVRTD